MTFYKWSQTAAADANADPTINWAEGQAPSSVNDSARAMMAATAKYRDDVSGQLGTTGSSTLYALTSFQGFDSTTDMDGKVIAFTPHTTNGTGAMLNVDGLGAQNLCTLPGVFAPAGTLIQGTPYAAVFNKSVNSFILQGFFGNPYNIPLGGGLDYWGTTAPNSNFAFPFGQAISRSTYSALFALMGTTYGTGDGSTTFNLPDKRGRISVSLDNMGGSTAGRVTSGGSGIAGTAVGSAGGFETYTQRQSDLPNIAPTFTGAPSSVSGATTQGAIIGNALIGGVSGGAGNAEAPQNAAISTLALSGSVIPQGAVSSINGGVTQTVMNNMPPSIVVPYILRII
jgi:microcystin-dependent protein